MTARDDIARPARTIAGFTLISRVLGLARDAALVRVFGDTAVGSAFNAAFALPNLFRRLFGEGALAAAVVPVYSDLATGDATTRDAYVRTLLLAIGVITGLITLVLEGVLLLLLVTLEPNPARDLSLRLMMIAIPFMPLVCIAATIGGMLQVHGRFAPAAAAPIILNLCVLATAGYRLFQHPSTPERSAEWVTLAVVAAGLLQVVWAIAELRRRTGFTGSFAQAGGATRRTLRAFLPAVIGMGTLQLSTVVDITIAMWPNWFGPTMFGREVPLDEASNAILSFTQRLYQFPLGVFGIAIATAAFPSLARVAKDPDKFGETLSRGVRLSAFIAIPATVGLFLVGPDLTRIMFTGGVEGANGFSEDGLARAQAVLAFYVLGLTAYSLNQILVRAFHARGDTMTPMRLGLVMLVVNLALNLVLIWPLREAGLAAATALGAGLQMIVLAILLLRQRAFGDRLSPIGRALCLHIGAAIVMGLALLGVRHLMPAETWAEHAVRLAGMTVIGAIIYVAIMWRSSERRWLMARGG